LFSILQGKNKAYRLLVASVVEFRLAASVKNKAVWSALPCMPQSLRVHWPVSPYPKIHEMLKHLLEVEPVIRTFDVNSSTTQPKPGKASEFCDAINDKVLSSLKTPCARASHRSAKPDW